MPECANAAQSCQPAPPPTCIMHLCCAGENPVPLVNEATGNKEGATRDNIPGLGDVSRNACWDRLECPEDAMPV